MPNLDLVGGDFHLIRLTQKVASSAHIEFHARIILQKYIQRRLLVFLVILLKMLMMKHQMYLIC